jgi:uncharacterized DUF497 family protein/predicted DNA binding CopG/RHH family protein
MHFTWDETKRRGNLGKHGFDFVDASTVFEGPTFTFEDDRFAYGEQRFITLGLLRGRVVVIAHTEHDARYGSFPCAREPDVSEVSSSNISQTDWARIAAMQDEDIDLSEVPEVTDEQMARAVLRVGGVPVERGKRRVNMFLDAVIVEYFKAKAGERGYQTLINEALAEYIRRQALEETLRRVIREELQRAAPPPA